MTVTLHSQSPVSIDQALTYLQDQGIPTDDDDLLKMHINGVVGMMLVFMARSRFIWTDGDQVTEYSRGQGDCAIYLKNAPIQKVVTVTLNPHTSPTVITGPGTALSNDDMWYEKTSGLLTLKKLTFPEGPSTAEIIYEAGYSSTDFQFNSLQMICLDAVASKWSRWKNMKHGVSSENKGDTSIVYSPTDFTETAIAELKTHRRTMFA